MVKYIVFSDPITKQREYSRQSGPIYGEPSAPVRWEDTVAPWLVQECEFTRGENEPCAFHHQIRDLVTLLYVDDCLEDGEEQDIQWASDKLEEGYECKDTEWLIPFKKLDYLGMEISQDHDYTYLSMQSYILSALETVGVKVTAKVSTPIDRPIDPDSGPLDAAGRKRFMTGTGCLGWIANTARPDIAYAHSRISQHMANPNVSAMDAVIRCFKYLGSTADLALRAPLYPPDIDLDTTTRNTDDDKGWQFYCDSDFAGNTEIQNKRRAQNGWIAVENEAPVSWSSKASSVAFASPVIGEGHADCSSGAAEIYSAGNATRELLHLSYVADEVGIDFPRPSRLQMDNSTAEAFANNSTVRSKLKHIDVRQEWVKTLRDKNLIKPVHVNTKVNIADILTKILTALDFIRLRDMIMHKLPDTID